jgi:hypothetical protein
MVNEFQNYINTIEQMLNNKENLTVTVNNVELELTNTEEVVNELLNETYEFGYEEFNEVYSEITMNVSKYEIPVNKFMNMNSIINQMLISEIDLYIFTYVAYKLFNKTDLKLTDFFTYSEEDVKQDLNERYVD